MNLSDIPLFSMLKGRLGYLSERQKVIAQNVANTDTARYIPEDLKPFSFDARVQAQRTGQAGAMSVTSRAISRRRASATAWAASSRPSVRPTPRRRSTATPSCWRRR